MRHEAATRSQHAAPGAEADLARLVRDAAAGDETAWERLVRGYSRRIYAMAQSRLRDPEAAEEITQSVFATLASTLRSGDASRYQERGRFEPWLFRVTMNRVRDEGRRRRRDATRTQRLAHGEPVPDRAGHSPAFDPDEITSLRDAVASLETRDREIIELRHHATLSFAQIAEMLGEPMGTVLARHHRALKKLRDRIENPQEHTATEGKRRA